ncbi:PREDICTED: uncharacterized protein LOC109182831 [Ipomoea nil]|uniref:uncharacterized protein LOC109182831 n=1 Tax=Ipomoea nil TaxID=35883 RepID=UPI000901509C|nr:PREDICTED: uncharacterized protein LOC109182831 [Ipomoea nil]
MYIETHKKLSAIAAWENTKKAYVEAQMKEIEGFPASPLPISRSFCAASRIGHRVFSSLVFSFHVSMAEGGDLGISEWRGPLVAGVGRGKKTRVLRCAPGGDQSCVSDDDFVSPPLAFLSRLQQDPVWQAVDDVCVGGSSFDGDSSGAVCSE